ncbi:MAG TPA: hypothetical protein GXX46_00505 [Peptococcaceae bacterium]|nr:hypothetical protein [Peptococcaceae bacterium]
MGIGRTMGIGKERRNNFLKNVFSLTSLTLLTSLILCALVLVGCSIGVGKETIYDDAQRIARDGDSYSFYHRIGEIGRNSLALDYSRFYGVQTIWVWENEEPGEIAVDYDSQVTSGKFKVVLVTPEGRIINIAEQSGKGSFKIAASRGKYSLKIVGYDAKGAIRLERQEL